MRSELERSADEASSLAGFHVVWSGGKAGMSLRMDRSDLEGGSAPRPLWV